MRKLTHEEIPRADPATLTSLPRHPITTLLHDIRSVHNVGSMLRTADSGRIERLYISGYTATPHHPSIHRTALGAQDVVPWERTEDPAETIGKLRRMGHTVAALEITDVPTPIRTLSLRHFPLCIVVGNEVKGVPQQLIDLCDMALEIPQYGMKQSLNVAVAYGVAVLGAVERFREIKG